MAGSILKPDLSVPEQKTSSLSFCEASPKALKYWVEHLPMANIGETSRLLYHAIIELNQLFAAPQQRLQLLELIRPKIHFVCKELSRHYLGMAVALPDKQRKIANLSQALQLHCASGYKLCLLDWLDQAGLEKQQKQLAEICHRALAELSATIVRAHQLYCPTPPRSWLECHRIFRFAYEQRLTDLVVQDDALMHRHASTVADCYKRTLLLGCARPNQLRQNELSQAYELFECWTDRTTCSEDTRNDSVFLVNMEQDNSPVYRDLLSETPGNDFFSFETRALAEKLASHLHDRENARKSPKNTVPQTDLELPFNVSDTLLQHLSQSLGSLAKRNFNRIATDGSLEICVGLTAAHHFLAGEKSFTQFISGNQHHPEDENRFIRAARRKNEDAWSSAHDVSPSDDRLYSTNTPINFSRGPATPAQPQPHKNRPKSHHAALVNASPGGYCVRWDTSVPTSLQAGEILGVREQSSHPWSVAVVRWIRQVKHQGTQLGIELLAPTASPCGVRLIQKVGQSSEYLRGLMLPEISVINQAATLITPRLPFQSGSRISLLHHGHEDQGLLTKKISSTGSISQFELKLHNQQLSSVTSRDEKGGGTSEDEFDSLWPSL